MERQQTPQQARSAPDFQAEYHGSIAFMQPITDEARAWIAEHVQVESWQWHGDAFAVEPRMLPDLISGIKGDGLTVMVSQ